jgi:hypothetical protein
MTAEEREKWLRWRGPPRPNLWLASLVCFLVATGCGGGVIHAIISLFDRSQRYSSPLGLAVGATAGVLLAVKFVISARRRRARERRAREAIAESGVVEVAEIAFERMWRIPESDDCAELAVLEATPHVLLMVPVPKDEDEHARLADSVRSHGFPKPVINGTFPRERLRIEWVTAAPERLYPGGPFIRPKPLLTVSWLGDQIVPAGEIGYDQIPSRVSNQVDLRGIEWLPELTSGPWMMGA